MARACAFFILLSLTASVAVGAPARPTAPASSPIARAPTITPADVPTLLREIRRPGARAVLVNVWATWCDPCRAEMPRLARFFQAHRAEGLRLVLISADEETERGAAAAFLGAQGIDVPTWLKRGDDMSFIEALDKRWTGALPASFLFDGGGALRELWQGELTQEVLERAWAALPAPARPTTKPLKGEKP